ADADEVVENRLGRQLLDDPRARPATGEPGRDDGDVEALEGARDVDPLAACEHEDVARTVAMAKLEDRHGHRPVERRVEGDGDDHLPLFTKTALPDDGGYAWRTTVCGRAGPVAAPTWRRRAVSSPPGGLARTPGSGRAARPCGRGARPRWVRRRARR